MSISRNWIVAITWLAVAVPLCAHAEELTDPTRPPASIAAPVAEAGTAVQAAGLQSIIIAANRRAAIIDGQTIELGGKFGDARLIAVNTSSVVLRTASGQKRLTLFPGVKITSSQAKAATLRNTKPDTGREKK